MPSGSMLFERVAAQASLYPPEALTTWGTVLIIAPHPDDESLGCGGAIALLRRQAQPVHVLFVSDGTMSHPRSQRYPAEARRALREQEAHNALAILGVNASEITFLRLPDTQVPTVQEIILSASSAGRFKKATSLIYHHLQRIRPQTVLVPWRRDPHGDHRATWQLLRAAVDRHDTDVRWLEYPIWVWETTQPDDMPSPADGVWFKLDISEVLPQKRQAIAAHVSQTTSLIDDDPDGFMLSPAMISHFTQPYEYYLAP